MDRLKFRRWLIGIGIFVAGFVLGGYLFADTQPRSFLAIGRCNNACLKPNEFLGLIGSVGMQRFESLIPGAVLETDYTLAIRHPAPEAKTHFVVIPKRDVADVGDLSEGDQAYLADAFAVIGELIKQNGLTKYKVITYGPGLQEVRYLHFHLMSE